MYSLRYFLKKNIVRFNVEHLRNFQGLEKVCSKLPTDNQAKNKVDENTIVLLEKLSLVDCVNKEDIKTLEVAIDFADQIFEVNTTNIEPLITILEDYPLRVREDTITEGNCKEDILKNAFLTEEDYFVAPPGNIPLEQKDISVQQSNENIKSKY